MSESLAAFLGGFVGGGLVGLWHSWQRVLLLKQVAASTEALIAEHDVLVRGLIERIRELEEGP